MDLSFLEIGGLIFLFGLAWFWYSSSGAREAGIQSAKSACESEGLQLLDDTVAFASVHLQRKGDGQLALHRVYNFEFSDTGNNRRNGSVVLLGDRVLVVDIGLRLVSAETTVH